MKACITKDKMGAIKLFNNIPKKSINRGIWIGRIVNIDIKNSDLPADINQEWKDDKPIEVEIEIKPKK